MNDSMTFEELFGFTNLSPDQKEQLKAQFEQCLPKVPVPLFEYVPFSNIGEFFRMCAYWVEQAQNVGADLGALREHYIKISALASAALEFCEHSFCSYGVLAEIDITKKKIIGICLDSYCYSTANESEGLAAFKRLAAEAEEVFWMYFSEESKTYAYNEKLKQQGEYAPFVRLGFEVGVQDEDKTEA